MKPADLDRVRALLLRADALWEGHAARLAAAPPSRSRYAKPGSSARETAHAVDVSTQTNRFHLTLQGFLDAAQAEAVLLEVQLALQRVRPGFDVVSDVSRLGALTAAAVPYLRRVATTLVEAGMRQMVRVVGSSSGAATNVARAVEGLYQARVVASTREATRLLDGTLYAGRPAAPPSTLVPATGGRRGARRRVSAAALAAKRRH